MGKLEEGWKNNKRNELCRVRAKLSKAHDWIGHTGWERRKEEKNERQGR